MKVRIFFYLLLSAFLLNACGVTPVHDGEKLPRDQVAYIAGLPGWNPLSLITVQVYSIDSKKVTRKTNTFEVKPGMHRLEVRCSHDKPEFVQRYFVFNINMKAGARYRPKLDMSKDCHVDYIESATGRKIIGIEN